MVYVSISKTTIFYKGVFYMTSMLVKFEKPNQVVDFVNTISRYDYDADIRYGSRMVDAKSILGVIYLAVSHTVELILHTEEANCRDLQRRIAKFTV